MQRRRTALLAPLLALLLLFCGPLIAAGDNLLWKVSADRGSAYLLGSIHFGADSMYPLNETIIDAFEASQALVVEFNLLAVDLVEMARMMTEKGFYTDGRTLQSQLDPGLWQAVVETAERYPVPSVLLQPQKPWLAVLTLTVLELKRSGFSEDLGIDKHFLDLANTAGKPIIELESFAQQIELFEQFSDAEQATMLRQTLHEIENSEQFFNEVITAWKTGAGATLDTLLNDQIKSDPASERIYRVLLTDRNHAMVDKIEQLMSAGGTYFVVVGAGHLVGDEGIVKLFEQRGYAVARP